MPDTGTPSFRSLIDEVVPWKALVIGANPVDGPPVFAVPLAEGHVEVVGFEPNPAAWEELEAQKGPGETYLPHAVGDGATHLLYVCQASGMSSLLMPNADVLNLFHGFQQWAQVVARAPISTVRLDDVPEAVGADLIQIDIQGAELMALQHAEARLRDAVVVQCEAEFLPMYVGQPLFSEVEVFMRERGFMLHRLWHPVSRIVRPLLRDDDPFASLGQILWSDVVFVRDLTRLHLLSDRQMLVMAAILHDCYGSADLALHLLSRLDRRDGGERSTAYFAGLRGTPMAA